MITKVYFVRHAQPDFTWKENLTRPLTKRGLMDQEQVTETLKNFKIDKYFSSPYKRSYDTIKISAKKENCDIVTDFRFRERDSGANGNNFEWFNKRWQDFDLTEDGGEPLNVVQQRNIEVLNEILKNNEGENIAIGTHGTSLSTILNYYEKTFKCDDFIRIIDFMPYIIRLDFEGTKCIGKEEILIVHRKFQGKKL